MEKSTIRTLLCIIFVLTITAVLFACTIRFYTSQKEYRIMAESLLVTVVENNAVSKIDSSVIDIERVAPSNSTQMLLIVSLKKQIRPLRICISGRKIVDCPYSYSPSF